MSSRKVDSMLRDLHEIGHPDKKREVATRFSRWLRVEAERAEETLQKLVLQAETLRDHPGVGRPDLVLTVGALGFVLTPLDIPVQLSLNASAFGWSGWLLWGASVGLPAALAVVAHGVVMSLTEDEYRPRRSVRLAKSWSWGTFFLCAAAGAFLLGLRVLGASQVAFLTTAAGVALLVVAEGFPLTAGAFFAWAYHLGAPLRNQRGQQACRQRLDALQAAQQEVAVTLAVHTDGGNGVDDAGEGAVPVPMGESPLLGSVGQIAMLLLLGTALLTHSASAQCAWLSDRSASPDSVHWRRADVLVAETLPEAARALGCDQIVVIPVGGDGTWSEHTWIEVPSLGPELDEPCSMETAALAPTERALLAYASFRQHFEEEARSVCHRRLAADSTRREARWRSFTTEAREAVLLHSRRGSGLESDLLGALAETLQSGVDLVVFQTDLLDTTHEAFRLSAEALHDGSKVVVLAVPADRRWGGPEATERAMTEWRKLLPKSIIVPYVWLSDPDVWTKIARRLRP